MAMLSYYESAYWLQGYSIMTVAGSVQASTTNEVMVLERTVMALLLRIFNQDVRHILEASFTCHSSTMQNLGKTLGILKVAWDGGTDHPRHAEEEAAKAGRRPRWTNAIEDGLQDQAGGLHGTAVGREQVTPAWHLDGGFEGCREVYMDALIDKVVELSRVQEVVRERLV
jgi:hypothetical protein